MFTIGIEIIHGIHDLFRYILSLVIPRHNFVTKIMIPMLKLHSNYGAMASMNY